MQQELFPSAIEDAQVGLYEFDLVTGESRLSPAFRELFGLTAQDRLGSLFEIIEFFYPLDRERARLEFEAALDPAGSGRLIGEYARQVSERDLRQILLKGKTDFAEDNGRRRAVRFNGIALEVTGRKQTEQLLQESEERFRASVENMLDCFGIYSTIRNEQGQIIDFRIDFVNEAACLNNLLSKEQQIGQRLCELLPGHREQGLFDDYCRLVETGQPLIKQTLMYQDSYNGKILERAFDIRASKLGDGFVVAWRDVTTMVLNTNALRESEERAQARAQEITALMATTPAVIWIAHDPECQIITGSHTAYQLLRMSAGANLSKTAPEPEQPTHFRVYKDGIELSPDMLPVQLAARGITVRDFEEEIVFDDGGRHYLLGNAVPLHDQNGNLRGAISAFVDITERKLVEQALSESEERLRLFIMQAPVAIAMFDRDMRYIAASHRWITDFKLPEQSIIGRSHYQVFPDLPEHWKAVHRRALAGETIRLEEEQFIFADQSAEWLRWEVRPWLNRHNEIAGITIFNEIITARKLVEAERERLLAREQQARAEADAANRAKDEFLAIVSHELRTPLTAIIGWTRLLKQGKLGGHDLKHAIDIIERNATTQTRLIEDLLDISRIISGKIQLQLQPLALNSIVSKVAESLKPAAQEKGLRWEFELDNRVCWINGDVTRIEQIVSNLLNNAIKFNLPNGLIKVQLRAEKDRVNLIVTDTGRGIHADFLPHIFERFRQENRSTNQTRGGLGLGLAIVRHLIEMHQGTIEISSEGEGKGSTVIVNLPMTADPALNRSLPDQPQINAIHNSFTNALLGLRILVVDDDETAKHYLEFTLQLAGAQVEAASSAYQALEIYKRWQPQILVSDISMPAVDGNTLIAKIRQLETESEHRILALAITANVTSEYRRRALMAGFQIYLPKPIDPEELILAIKNHKKID